MKKIVHIVGARPNFIKAAPVISNIEFAEQIVIHTGQHYDKGLSQDIIDSLNMAPPDVTLSLPLDLGTFGRLSYLIENLSIKIKEIDPDLVVLYGDVDSTLAGAIVSSRMNIPIAHVESGLRSFDDSMPEEINRKVVDRLSSIHFVTEKSALDNLLHEGFDESICFVGNSMIDSLKTVIESKPYRECGYQNYGNILLTCHRPSNVDSTHSIERILKMCKKLNNKIVWPIHPRTLKKIEEFNMLTSFKNIENLEIIDPLDYCSFMKMMATSKLVITDSGGIQEETTFLKVPCLTIRENTERPITISIGSNTLVTFELVDFYVNLIYDNKYKESTPPRMWDGDASKRMSAHIRSCMENRDWKK